MATSKISFLIILFLSLFCCSYSKRDQNLLLREEDVEMEKQLRQLNKPPVMTLKTQYGETIDCIDINKQPAFDHPLLKDHKIQRKPNLPSDFRMEEASTREARTHVNITRIRCPPGTVPIVRATKASLARAKDYGQFHPTSQDSPGLHIAPELFMDTLTHLFIEWDDLKHNGFKAGCINLLCPGFVQVDRSFYPGMAFHHVSVVNGEQMELRSMIRQDNQTGNWWLHNLDSTPVGYWPAAILPKFSDGASFFSVGGTSQAPVGAQYPPMGSGQLPNGDYSHSAYYRELQFVNSAGYLEDIRYKTTTVITTNLACFGFENKGWDGEDMRYAIQYGGPGGDCPAKSY